MIFLAQNIKYLRGKQKWTQQRLADELNVKRALIGSYEEGRATPKLVVLQRLSALFGISVDDLISLDLKNGVEPSIQKPQLQILPVVVDKNNNEQIPIVPVKASAGYLNGMADPEFIGNLPRFTIPVPELSSEKTYRVFQIKGDSMLPVLPGSYIFCEYISQIDELRDGKTYILITKDEGIVYKRCYLKEDNKLLLKSDNPDYDPYFVEDISILEIWKAKGVLSFDLPEPVKNDITHLSSLIQEMRDDIRSLNK